MVHKYGDNVDTDVIIPARYLNIGDLDELTSHAMEDIDSDFVKKVKPGDILAAGANFGCGSSREHAPIVLKRSGISAVIAGSFARIFYRNAVNIGLPVVECEAAAAEFENGDDAAIDFKRGVIINKSKNREYKIDPLPEFLAEIYASGGLVEYVKGNKF